MRGGTPIASMSPRTMRAHLILADYRMDRANPLPDGTAHLQCTDHALSLTVQSLKGILVGLFTVQMSAV